MSRQPPLNSLRFFEAAARLGSFVKAGDELRLTHGAVSRQIRLLEQSLELDLFERRNRGVFLTPQGEQLLAAAQYAFEHLNTAIDALRKPLRHMPLVISWALLHKSSLAGTFPFPHEFTRYGRTEGA